MDFFLITTGLSLTEAFYSQKFYIHYMHRNSASRASLRGIILISPQTAAISELETRTYDGGIWQTYGIEETKFIYQLCSNQSNSFVTVMYEGNVRFIE